jgi:hypothetical protein
LSTCSQARGPKTETCLSPINVTNKRQQLLLDDERVSCEHTNGTPHSRRRNRSYPKRIFFRIDTGDATRLNIRTRATLQQYKNIGEGTKAAALLGMIEKKDA